MKKKITVFNYHHSDQQVSRSPEKDFIIFTVSAQIYFQIFFSFYI